MVLQLTAEQQRKCPCAYRTLASVQIFNLFLKHVFLDGVREKCYPHQARKAYLGPAMRDR